MGIANIKQEKKRVPIITLIMRGYFDGSMPHRAVRRELGCRDQYAVMVRSCLYEVLDLIHDRAMADMTEVLERHGLIRDSLTNSLT